MPSDASFIAEMSVLGVGLIAILGASYMLNKSDNNYYSNKSKTSSRSRSSNSNLTRRRTTSSDKYSITYKSKKSNSSKQ
jgi:hypothetical protein